MSLWANLPWHDFMQFAISSMLPSPSQSWGQRTHFPSLFPVMNVLKNCLPGIQSSGFSCFVTVSTKQAIMVDGITLKTALMTSEIKLLLHWLFVLNMLYSPSHINFIVASAFLSWGYISLSLHNRRCINV